ncbi:MAG: hypothetical protein EPN75_02850 [Beijerinckiaceae bacterium]|nr:MAG: hypothetical protein EPN75_02850 [Beijerinckiaceae bacterium]
MKSFRTALLGAVVIISTLSFAVPAFALGGCGPNRHRGPGGRCYWGGQHQRWCVRHTGHRAVRMPNGNLRCFR